MTPPGPIAPMPRPTQSRSPYGLDIGRPAAPAPRPTFPSRVHSPAQPARPLETPVTPEAKEAPSARPPKGTDPELWKVLTADERAFFAREDAMGPLSYGHRITAGPTIPSRGGRINLRG